MSNLNNLPLNESGPRKISKQVFYTYQKLALKNIYDAIKLWTKPIHDTTGYEIQLLALRDILRQNYHKTLGYFDLDAHYTLLLHFEEFKDSDSFYYFLQKNKTHRQQFIKESMYNIKHGLLPKPSDKDFAELLEILIILGCEFDEDIDLKYLWSLHPVNQPTASALNRAWEELEFCLRGMCLHIPGAVTPEQFQQEIWLRLKQTLTTYLSKYNRVLRCRNDIFSKDQPYNQNIVCYTKPPQDGEELIIRFCQMVADNSKITEAGIELLENQLQDTIRYLPTECLVKILPNIKDRALAYACLKRHIELTPKNDLKKLNPNFLYWALGLSVHGSTPNNEQNTKKILQSLPVLRSI